MPVRVWGRIGAALAVLSLAAPAAHATSLSTSPAGLHVVHAGGVPYLADRAGRYVLLRGVDSNALVQYASDFQETVPLARADLQEMAALGFNFLRLAVSWSRIAPAPGEIDGAYLDQIRSVLSWAASEGIYVLVDLHQDRYNRHTWPGNEVDGAPDWATLTDGVACTPLEATTACAQAAEQNFWDDATVDGRPLQQWYLQALRAVASAVSGSPALAGIELMNEPTQGALPPVAFEQTELYPFYRRMIAGLRRAGVDAPLWFEPSVLRDLDDDAVPEAARFSADPQLVYAVHIYTDVFSPPMSASDPEAHLRTSYQAAAAEAAVFGTPWVDDEFGADASPQWDRWISEEQSLQDEFLTGSGFWLWKQQPDFYGWATVRPDGSLRRSTLRAQLLSEPHVDAVPGRLLSTTWAAGRLTSQVSGPGGDLLLWSGTQVLRGGPSLLPAPLTRVLLDGRPVPVTCQARSFSTAAVALGGCDLTVRIPPGRHVIVLTS